MTVQANLPPTNTNSDGVTTTFEYNFKVTREEHLSATYTVIATGETGELEIDSVTGIGDDAGGTVTFAEAPADGMIVTIDSVAPLSQIENFAGNRLPPETVERMGDAVVIQNQLQQSQIQRSVRFPPSDDEIPTLPARAQRADKILGFSSDGSDFVMVEGAAASQAYVDAAKVQADRAVAAVTYPYTSGETKSGAFMPGAGDSLTLFTYNSVSDAAVTLPALAGLATDYNIGICRTAGSGDLTITADDGALINGAASITLASDYLCLDLTVNEAGDEWVAVDKALIGLPVGTDPGDIVALDENGKLPAVDGSQLTGLDIGYPPGFIYNATVELAADTGHDITFGQFSLRNDANDANVDAASSLTKQIDATFAEGDNQGGMASGESIPTSGFLYAFAVTKDADGTVDVMYDTSDTGANVNAGWTPQRLLARIAIDASDNIDAIVNYYVGDKWVFESAETQIVSGGTATISHGLPTKPGTVKVWLRCLSDQHGYSAGDEVDVDAWAVGTGSTGNSRGCSILRETSDVVVVYGSSSNVFNVPDKTTGSTSNTTNTSWALIVRAKL